MKMGEEFIIPHEKALEPLIGRIVKVTPIGAAEEFTARLVKVTALGAIFKVIEKGTLD